MLTEDYIMRMINQALAVLMIALGLKRAGQLNEALQTFDQALESLLGLNANLAKQLDDKMLLELLTFRGRLDIDRVLVLADIYREEAEILSLRRESTASDLAARRSLRLYLEVALAIEAAPDANLIHKIEGLRLNLATPSLPVETRLALLDYFDRLLSTDDTFLASVDLSRPDLQRALSALDSPDLH